MSLQVSVNRLPGHAQALGNCRAVAPLLQQAHHQGVLVSQWAPGPLTQPQVGQVGAHHGRWNAQGLGDGRPAMSLSEHPGDFGAAVGNGWPLHEPNHQPGLGRIALVVNMEQWFAHHRSHRPLKDCHSLEGLRLLTTSGRRIPVLMPPPASPALLI
nr:hypothetical protein [Stenotrophomonas maltophilia]